MYKPRIVRFELMINGVGLGIFVDVNTRLGKNGIYPGDVDVLLSEGIEVLFLGITDFGKVVYAVSDGSLLIDNTSLWSLNPIKEWYNIKRHATPKLIKQMKQV